MDRRDERIPWRVPSVGRDAHVMVRTKDQARAFAREKVLQRLNLLRRSFLLSDHVVQAKDHHRVCVGENAFVDRQSLSGLIDGW